MFHGKPLIFGVEFSLAGEKNGASLLSMFFSTHFCWQGYLATSFGSLKAQIRFLLRKMVITSPRISTCHISHIKSHGNWEKKTSSKPGENATRTLEILENDGQTFTNGCFNRMIQTLYMKNRWKSPFPSIFNGLLGVPGCYYRRVRRFFLLGIPWVLWRILSPHQGFAWSLLETAGGVGWF